MATDLRDRYSARSFLLTKERKFLVRRADGSFDPLALRMTHKLLDTYTALAVEKRARLQKSVARLLCIGDAVKKDAWSHADLAAAGKLSTEFGFPIVIEVPDGGTRTGTSADGTQWSRVLDGMSYGFLPDTIAADAEELDAIVGKDITAPMVFVMDQGDEIKLALGYATAEDARAVYEKNWPPNMLKAIYEVPMSLVCALLCAEPGTLSKTLTNATKANSLMVMNAMGDVLGAVTKSAFDAPQPADLVQVPLDVALKARADRMRKMLDGARSYQGDVTSIDERPELAGHPARTSPLSWRYDNPEDVGGWLGAIEPSDESWIAFVDTTGRVLLWTNREPDGGIIGTPVSLIRPDLVSSAPATKDRFSHQLDVLPVVKSVEGEREFVAFGVVLEPEPNNGAGDLHRETYSEDFVRQTAHDYTAFFMNVDDQHGEFLPLTKAAVVESYITKQPEVWGARTVKAGSWILGVRITDPAMKAQILSGAKTGLSIEGFAERVVNTSTAQAA